MSRRYELMQALKSQLEDAFPDALVGHWLDNKPRERETVINFRDTGAAYKPTNAAYSHAIRVEIDMYVFGADLGQSTNNALAQLITAICSKASLGQRGVYSALEASGTDTFGDGYECGLVTLVISVNYSAPNGQS